MQALVVVGGDGYGAAMRSFPLVLIVVSALAACADQDRVPDGDDTDTTDATVDSVDMEDTEVDDVAADVETSVDTIDSFAEIDADTTDTDAATPSPGVFDRNHIVEVELTMAASDWNELTSQRRSLFALLGEGCMTGPSPDVFTWFMADTTIDGHPITRIGVRKKGFLGSLDSERPGLRLELDEFVDGQKLDGLERLTLNNGKQDLSRVRQCLAYDLFRQAGVPAPRCAFAHVVVNRVDLGLYVHVEAVKKPFLREWFGDIATGDAGDGALWEGQLSDFRPGWLDSFEAKHDDMGPADHTLLMAVASALEGDDEGLLQRLDTVIDLDGFFTFWAVESLTSHWDGFAGNTNNFFVYAPPGEDRRLRFIPWGVDQTFVDGRPFGGTRATFATSALTRRLYLHPAGRLRFETRLVELLDTVWDETELLASIQSMANLIRPFREPGTREAGDVAVAELATFVMTREDDIRGELASPPADFPPPLRDDLCLDAEGVVTATFSTTWGTLHIEDVFSTGSGTLLLESESLPELPTTLVGSKSGYSEETQTGQIVVGAIVSGGGFLAMLIELEEYPEVGTSDLGVFPQGALYYGAPSGEVVLVGLLSGTLELEAIDANAGAEVRGSVTATLWTGLGQQ